MLCTLIIPILIQCIREKKKQCRVICLDSQCLFGNRYVWRSQRFDASKKKNLVSCEFRWIGRKIHPLALHLGSFMDGWYMLFIWAKWNASVHYRFNIAQCWWPILLFFMLKQFGLDFMSLSHVAMKWLFSTSSCAHLTLLIIFFGNCCSFCIVF